MMSFGEFLRLMPRHKFTQLRQNCIRMTHDLISSFDSAACRKSILSIGFGNQAFSFLVNGTAVRLDIG